jgi:hypothetical protein
MREFLALKHQWAEVKALMLNLQANTEGVPFTADDLLYGGREERVQEEKSKLELAQMLAQMETFSPVDESTIPAWMVRAKEKQRGR